MKQTKGLKALIKFFEENKRVRQSAIAQLLGVSEAYISLLLSGKKQPSLKTACTIEAITSGKVKASDWLIQI